MEFHCYGILETFPGSSKIAKKKRHRNELGIFDERRVDFPCQRLKLRSSSFLPCHSQDPKDKSLNLKDYKRLFIIYAVGVAIATVCFLKEVTHI